MADIRPQRVESSGGTLSKRELYATVCYFYPRYSLKEAQALSHRDLILLLKIAQREQARKMLELTQISAAPHTKNGSGVKSLIKRYKEAIG